MKENADPASVRLERALREPVADLRSLRGGCVADVRLVQLPSGERLVAKLGSADDGLDVEGWMLGQLAGRLPVPVARHAEPDLLVMTHVEHDAAPRDRSAAEADAGARLAELHGLDVGDTFGLERDTRIGGLVQPNTADRDWVRFYRDQRLRHFGELAARRGNLDRAAQRALAACSDRLGELLPSAVRPSLIHGDVWGGNVLFARDRVAAFIDPAIYRSDAGVELAFIELFGTFGPAFFETYAGRTGIDAGWFDTAEWSRRRDIYQLYPLLVHAALFGGGYGASVRATLGRLGF